MPLQSRFNPSIASFISGHVEKNRQPASASAIDPATGETTTSISNGNGTRTVVRTDAQGKVLSSEVVR